MNDQLPPPNDIDAEQACLGAALLEPGACAIVTGALAASDFYREAHREIYGVVLELSANDEPVDLVTVASGLRRKGKLETVGGGEYLTALIAHVPTTAHAKRYSGIVKQTSVLRQAISLGSAIQGSAYGNPADAAEMIGPYLANLERLQELSSPDDCAQTASQVCGNGIERIEQRRSRDYEISTARFGIPELDRLTGGLEDAGYTILKGNTNAGKTSLMLQTALSTACAVEEREDCVIYVGMEEAAWRLQLRAMAWLGQFNSRAVKNAYAWQRACAADPELEERYWHAVSRFAALPLIIVEGRQSMGAIEAHCRRIMRKQRPRLICVDFLQKIIKDDGYEREEQAYREITDRFVRLREKVQCPVIGASQVSVGADGEEHTFGARFFEFDADTVLSIQRLKDDKTKQWRRDATLIVQKARELEAIGRFTLHTDFETGRWHALDQTRDEAETETPRRRERAWGNS